MLTKHKFWSLFAIAFIVFAAPFFWAIGCKPSQSNSGSAANSSSAGTQSEEVKVSSRTLTEWFAKQGVTSQEAKTVDAIIEECLYVRAPRTL